MPESPLVSIITPSYNQGRFLLETIQSVLSQDYPNLEYIIVDGGSTDGSLEIIQHYASQLTWWVSEPDQGQTDAINKGFAHAKGEILAWINSDDTYLPGAVSEAVTFLIAHPEAALVYADANLIDEQGSILGRFPAKQTSLMQAAAWLGPHPPTDHFLLGSVVEAGRTARPDFSVCHGL